MPEGKFDHAQSAWHVMTTYEVRGTLAEHMRIAGLAGGATKTTMSFLVRVLALLIF